MIKDVIGAESVDVKVRDAMITSSTAEGTPVVAYVSKMVAIPESEMPEERREGGKIPKNAVAHHINFDQGVVPKLFSHPLLKLEHIFKPYNKRENEGFARTSWFLNEGSGYRAEQSTKPQTLGYAFADSPVALFAWIYEKLHDWTDSYPWTDDEICTWISIYWFSTAGPAAAIRIYYETIHDWNQLGKNKITRERCTQWVGGGVKVGLSHFPKELRVLPSTRTRTQGNVVFEKEHPSGGHFAAWERPENIVSDLREMFGKGGGAYGVVGGEKWLRCGYRPCQIVIWLSFEHK